MTVTGLPHAVHFMIFPLGGTNVSGSRCSVPHASQVAVIITHECRRSTGYIQFRGPPVTGVDRRDVRMG